MVPVGHLNRQFIIPYKQHFLLYVSYLLEIWGDSKALHLVETHTDMQQRTPWKYHKNMILVVEKTHLLCIISWTNLHILLQPVWLTWQDVSRLHSLQSPYQSTDYRNVLGLRLSSGLHLNKEKRSRAPKHLQS